MRLNGETKTSNLENYDIICSFDSRDLVPDMRMVSKYIWTFYLTNNPENTVKCAHFSKGVPHE